MQYIKEQQSQVRSSKAAAVRQHSNNAACANSALLLLLLQVCWEKFNEYFEVEGRYVPVEVDYPVMSADRIEQYADENTIGERGNFHQEPLASPLFSPQICGARYKCSHGLGLHGLRC